MEGPPKTKKKMKTRRREADSKKRDDMSPNTKEQFLKYQAEQKARIRNSRKEELNCNLEDMTYLERWNLFRKFRLQFQKQIEIGCPYICVVCFTTRYR